MGGSSCKKPVGVLSPVVPFLCHVVHRHLCVDSRQQSNKQQHNQWQQHNQCLGQSQCEVMPWQSEDDAVMCRE